MSRLYKRNLQVIIGEDDGNAVKVETLKVAFEVTRVLSGNVTEGFVAIYNLNESTETRIRDRATRVRLLAGYGSEYVSTRRSSVVPSGSLEAYESSLSLLHDGQISQVERVPTTGNDRITYITLAGNVFRLSMATTVVSYEGAVPIRRVVADAIPSFGLTEGSINVIPESAEVVDFAFSGSTGDLLDRILNPLAIQWTENDGVILMSARGTPIFEDVAVLRAGTGMIQSPGVTDRGIKVRSLLNPRIVIGGRVQIVSEVLTLPANDDAASARAGESQGLYKVVKLVHRGDNWDGEFVTEIEGEPTT